MDSANSDAQESTLPTVELEPGRLLVMDDWQLQTFLIDATADRQLKLDDRRYSMWHTQSDLEIVIHSGTVVINGQPLAAGETRQLEQLRLHVMPKAASQYFDLMGLNHITVGPYSGGTIELTDSTVEFDLQRFENDFQITVLSGDVYVDDELIGSEPTFVGAGSSIYFDEVLMSPKRNYLELIDPYGKASVHQRMRLTLDDVQFPEGYPDYHRSPRIIYRAPEEQVKIEAPEQEPTSPDQHLGRVLLPPLVMVAMSVMMIILSGSNPVMMLSMVGMSLATVVGSVLAYFRGKKDYRAQSAVRKEKYDEYLNKRNGELGKLRHAQIHSLDYHYPSLAKIDEMVREINPRIYEKTPLHFDFLTYRVGLGDVPASFEVGFDAAEFSEDPLIQEGRDLKKYHETLTEVPITTDLMHGPVGIIWPRYLTIEHIQQMMLQLATFQSYRDVEFLAVFPESEKPKWWWLRWLPHFTMHATNVRSFIWHERSRDQVLNSFNEILKSRDQSLKEAGSKEKLQFKPHYVVFLTNDELILDHPIMEYFSKDLTALGVSLVFVADVIQSLPEHVKTVIDIGDSNHGKIIIEQGKLADKSFVPDHFNDQVNRDEIVHRLAGLNHLENLKNSIPEKVTFLEMYGQKYVDGLDVGHRWQTNKPFKSLAVPLGERAPEDIVTLNLHEKADGPHGLLAGTTGSGKSEVLQTYIISLALNFQPSDVGFLLIDYKGGGMANLFKDLPHLLGAITNLDGAQSMRTLESIKAELRRRQRLFGEFNVNHINQYQRLFNEGVATEPIPHLFLISDEFAELKTNQPDFMAELVSTARIGRSLGVHLILATQKPSGVVDDQIWSNSKFRISLKVQNAEDSQEVLHTPDAASIVEPGRGYLQVGNNEKYELFQTAYSGSEYDPDKDEQAETVLPLYSINEMGQYEVITQDLSDERDEKTENIQKKPSELEAVINYIHDYAAEHDIHRLPQPWLPPLAKSIPAVIKGNFINLWAQPANLQVDLGMVDIPSEQAQRPLAFDLLKDTHTAVFGSAGYGKSTFLQTVVMQYARQNSPEQMQFYLLDFGTNGLLPLRNLPHVADLIRADETEKLNKFMQLISRELKRRKQLLNAAGVATLMQYEAETGKGLPVIEIVIDGFDAILNTKFEETFRDMTSVIAREGSGVGLYLLISAAQASSLRTQLAANIKTQLVLFLIDQDEVQNVVGRTQLKIDDAPGRGLIKLDEPRLMQIYLPNDGKDELEVLDKVRQEAHSMADSWEGATPSPIPMMPDEFKFGEFITRKDVQDHLLTKSYH